MIERWNECVRPNDDVYHLGDLGWFQTIQDVQHLCAQLNGHKHLILGNHDRLIRRWSDHPDILGCFEWIKELYTLKHQNQRVVLCHYAMRVWDGSHHGTGHVYGHSHGNLEGKHTSKSFDVGVDSNDFRPLSIDEVLQRLDTITGGDGD